MANYLLVYNGGGMPETEAEQAGIKDAWMTWFGALGSSVVDGGNPFSGMASTIASDGTVTNGSMGSTASGYSVIKANSLEEATKMAQGCPVLKGGAKITVYETFEVM